MDGFKNSTRTQYMKGGSCDGYAKGGRLKGAAKFSKVMGEFKRGDLHSGSKKGPEVTSKKQATAIALSEARKAGAKIPQPVQKKSLGGVLKAMSPAAMLADSKVGKDLMGAGVFGVGGLLLNQLMKKKQSGQTLTPAENQQLAQAQQGQTAMQKGGPVKKNMGGAMGSGRKQALATRASAASNEARNAQMARKPAPPKRGPAGAGFEAKPMVNKLSADKVEAMRDRMATGMRKPAETSSATDSSPERQRAEADLKAAMQRDAEERNPMKPMVMGPAGKGSRDPRAPMVSGPPPMMKKGGLAAMPKGKKC